MPYTEELKNLIKIVEKTRPARLAMKKRGEEFPMMSLDEREARLKKYHPDYKEEGRRELMIGPSKGYKIANEFADLLEAHSRIDPDRIDLSRLDMETDVLIIGGGGAGTVAAILAERSGASVVLATKLRHGDAKKRLFGVSRAQYDAMTNQQKNKAKEAAVEQFIARMKVLFQRRHDCIHNCDRPKVAPQAIGPVQAKKALEDISFLVERTHQALQAEFPRYLQRLGFDAVVRNRVTQ